MSPIARMLASSVARGVSSGVSMPSALVSSRNALNPLLGVLAQRHAGLLRAGDRLVVDVGVVHRPRARREPQRCFSVRRSTSTQTKVRKLPMWARA